jgi:hypothetical protein
MHHEDECQRRVRGFPPSSLRESTPLTANQTPSCLYQFHRRPRRDSPLRHVGAMQGTLEIGEEGGRSVSATSSLVTAAEGASGEGGEGASSVMAAFFTFHIFLEV